MKPQKIPTSIPPSLYTFFWDVNPANVNPLEKPYFVINRLLDKGNVEAARWVLNNFSKDVIAETLRKIRDFSPWNGTFWARYLDVPIKEVRCLDPSYRTMRKQLWPY
ncbi:hypothetical protein HY086_05040 [Candidatus Gottesmanbacteria bacterium]|nr:hypothetical protein [Candidatus Gottesmanbacteria bacterium]